MFTQRELMKKFITSIFVLLLIVPVYKVYASPSAEQEYDICFAKYTLNYDFDSDKEFSSYYSAKYNEAKKEYEAWLNTVKDYETTGNCGPETYVCKPGQKNKDCVPEACWSMYDESQSPGFKFMIEEEYRSKKILKECGEKPEGNTAEAKNKPTQKEKATRKSDKKNQSSVTDQKNDTVEKNGGKSADKAQKNEEKRAKKEAECKGKNPPMDVKKNSLGLWVCTDSAETIANRENKKQNNKALKEFWNDMDELESAFHKRVKELQKASKSGGKK